MKAKFLLASAVGAIAIASAGVSVVHVGADKGAPFVNPLLFASSICGDGKVQQLRRAYFLKIGAAVAAETAPKALAGAPEKFGAVSHRISTSSAEAQAWFDSGLAYAWNFNHGAAIESFKAAQAADPNCAMCYWGEAFSWGPNINDSMHEEAAAPAFAAAKKAKSLAGGASDKEKALIDALLVRYSAKPPKDRMKLDAAFADAMDKAARQYADDPFVLSLAAEANMDTQPWDYWEADRRTAKGRADRSIELIEAALARDPHYIPAIHLYIHMTENTTNPYRAEPYADKLASLSPGLGHLIHMPGHTYYRIGRFKDSLEINVVAAEADEAFLNSHQSSPLYEYGYYVHNLHFIMTSALMAGDGATALDAAKKLDAKLPAQMARDVPFSQPIKASPYYAYAQFGAPEEVLKLEDPGDELPLLQGAWRYARGEAYARAGDAAGVKKEAAEIGKLIDTADFSAMESQMVPIPATMILKMALHTVNARAAALGGDYKTAIKEMEDAVALQSVIPYTEPPYWYYPAKQTLAGMVLRSGDKKRAEALFVETLAESPNNAWALYGLSATYKAMGDKSASKYASTLFRGAWAGQKNGATLAGL